MQQGKRRKKQKGKRRKKQQETVMLARQKTAEHLRGRLLVLHRG